MEISGVRMLTGLLTGIALLIVLVLKTRVHVFLALILCTIVVGLVGGMPMKEMDIVNAAGEHKQGVGIIHSITDGFGDTLGSIGIMIGFGVMMGQIFEASGAAKRLAYTFLKLFGKGREEAALTLTGFLVSIPIFCDSGFILLAPVAKALSRMTKKSVISLGVSLAAGLVITHSLVPPTPGPLGVCGIFGIDVGMFALLSIALAIPMSAACLLYAKKYLARKYLSKEYSRIQDGNRMDESIQEPSYNMVLQGTPGSFACFLPLLLPIMLILINTVATSLKASGGVWDIVICLGQPIIALGIGLLTAIVTLGRPFSRESFLKEMEKGMGSAGTIILVTGGGGALGRIITDSGLGGYIASGLSGSPVPLILLPLVISTLMRLVQGSGTVAMTTAASMTAPILMASGMVSPMLSAAACCVGSLFFSSFNDSYFWVVNRTLGITEAKEQIQVWSVTSTIAWAVGAAEVLLLSIFIH